MMVPYARFVALFRIFQTIWRNLHTVPAIISFVRRAVHFLWRRKGDLNMRGRAPNSPDIDLEGDGRQPMVFAASQDLSPGVAAALLQNSATSNDVEHPGHAASILHPPLRVNPEDEPASETSGAHSTSFNDAESFYESASSGSHSSLKPTTKGPPTLSKESTETSNHDSASTGFLALSVEYPGFGQLYQPTSNDVIIDMAE